MSQEFNAKLDITCAKLDRTAGKIRRVIDLQNRTSTPTGGTPGTVSAEKISAAIVRKSRGGAGT